METIHTETYKNFQINISFTDCDCVDDPLQLFLSNNGAKLFGNFRDFSFENDFSELVEGAEEEGQTVAEYLKNNYQYFWPVWGYSHSGVSVSLGREYPYNDRFDSGLYGMIVLDKLPEGYNTIDEFFEGLQAVISDYNQWLSGEVYGYLTEDASGEIVDSCCGYFSMDDLLSDARDVIDFHIEKIKSKPEAVAILGTTEDVDNELKKVDPEALRDYFLQSSSEARKRQALATLLETK